MNKEIKEKIEIIISDGNNWSETDNSQLDLRKKIEKCFDGNVEVYVRESKSGQYRGVISIIKDDMIEEIRF